LLAKKRVGKKFPSLAGTNSAIYYRFVRIYLPFRQTTLAPSLVSSSPILYFHNRTPLCWQITFCLL
jgi:hypothetical protein